MPDLPITSADYISSSALGAIGCGIRTAWHEMAKLADERDHANREELVRLFLQAKAPRDAWQTLLRSGWVPATSALAAVPHLRLQEGVGLYCLFSGGKDERRSKFLAVQDPFLNADEPPEALRKITIGVFNEVDTRVELPAGLDWNILSYFEDDDEPVAYLERSLFVRWGAAPINTGHGAVWFSNQVVAGPERPSCYDGVLGHALTLVERDGCRVGTTSPPRRWNPVVYHHMNFRLKLAPKPKTPKGKGRLDRDDYTVVEFYVYSDRGDLEVNRYRDFYRAGKFVWGERECLARLRNAGYIV